MKFMKWVPTVTVTVNVHRNCGSQKSLVTDRFDHQTFAFHTYLTLAYSHTCITIPSLESLFKIKKKKIGSLKFLMNFGILPTICWMETPR